MEQENPNLSHYRAILKFYSKVPGKKNPQAAAFDIQTADKISQSGRPFAFPT